MRNIFEDQWGIFKQAEGSEAAPMFKTAFRIKEIEDLQDGDRISKVMTRILSFTVREMRRKVFFSQWMMKHAAIFFSNHHYKKKEKKNQPEWIDLCGSQ